MKPITLNQVREFTGGRMRGENVVITSVTNDSRAVQPGSLYVAIRGDTPDGHKVLAAAAANGAAAALVENMPDDAPADLPVVLTSDARRAFGNLAAAIRLAICLTRCSRIRSIV